MTETDFKNLKIIEDLVSRHFSLHSDSIATFKQKLYEPETDPFIQRIFGDTKDFRIRFPVTDKLLERFDQGWKIFLSYFRYFAQASEIDYCSFRANKVTFKRQAMKLKKAIFDFYMEDEALAASFLGIDRFNPEDDADAEMLEERIIKLLDKVGVAKLPSSGMEIVVSLNFADWFISSTGENWTSCLNLESNFSGCFWSGLPGLVTDKNRVMVYITNGAKKNYKGIVTESVLSRSWAMLDTRDQLNVVRYFPAEKISTGDIRSITGLPFVTNRDWISKNPVDLLWFIEDKSAFIYQDFSKFVKKDGKWYIRGHEQGRYGYIDKKTDELVESIHIFGYKGGLGRLIETNASLSDMTRHSCAHCGEFFEAILEEFEGHRYCPRCFNGVTIICADCGKRVHRERGAYKEVLGGNYVCDTCFTNNYDQCDNCGYGIRKENVIKFHHGKFCKSCLEADETIYRYCMTCRCGSTEENDDYETRYVTLDNHETICKSCLKKEMDKGQYLLDLPDPKKKDLSEYFSTIATATYMTTATANPFVNYRLIFDNPPVVQGDQFQQGQMVETPIHFDWVPQVPNEWVIQQDIPEEQIAPIVPQRAYPDPDENEPAPRPRYQRIRGLEDTDDEPDEPRRRRNNPFDPPIEEFDPHRRR